MTAAQKTEDGLVFEDGRLTLADGRVLAWRWWGDPGGTPVLRIQGTPASRLNRNPDATIQRDLGVRYLMADRPGYGCSTRKPGRGVADVTDDLVALLDAHGLGRVPVMGTSGGGPHALAIAARHPDRISAVSVVVGAAPLVQAEIGRLVGVNAEGYAAAQKGWAALYAYLVPIREQLLGDAGMQGVLHDAPPTDRAIMESPVWQRLSRENLAESLRQGAEGWADESLALNGSWDFDPRDVKATVTWWHSEDDKNAPLSAARRVAAQLQCLDMHIWHGEGHFASLVHDKEIVGELIDRAGT
ncbi:MAG TPA: alpha/beta hydrolase [Candidatus Dormibacteraeota bacterium]|nr:alpha/beta hydrolase [Candidatus Dormibacteraeota bacterium]